MGLRDGKGVRCTNVRPGEAGWNDPVFKAHPAGISAAGKVFSGCGHLSLLRSNYVIFIYPNVAKIDITI